MYFLHTYHISNFFSHFPVSLVNQSLQKLPRRLLFCHMSTHKKLSLLKYYKMYFKVVFESSFIHPVVSNTIITWGNRSAQYIFGDWLTNINYKLCHQNVLSWRLFIGYLGKFYSSQDPQSHFPYTLFGFTRLQSFL